ncbi:MAG: hypothetical protein LBL33_08235 [Tannerella sp.]|jgi:hypothetical protein|nr:hypothetical protein [Tannerella sp.]
MKKITISVIIVLSVFSCDSPPQYPAVLSRYFSPLIKFENYSEEEIRDLKIYWIRGDCVIDTCFMSYLDSYNSEPVFIGELEFKLSNDTIFKSDTILLSIADKTYRMYNIEEIAVLQKDYILLRQWRPIIKYKMNDTVYWGNGDHILKIH